MNFLDILKKYDKAIVLENKKLRNTYKKLVKEAQELEDIEEEEDVAETDLVKGDEGVAETELFKDEEDVSAHTGDDLVYKVAYGEAGYRDADDADEHEHERHGVVLYKAQNSLTERDGLFAYVFIFHFEPSVFLVRA